MGIECDSFVDSLTSILEDGRRPVRRSFFLISRAKRSSDLGVGILLENQLAIPNQATQRISEGYHIAVFSNSYHKSLIPRRHPPTCPCQEPGGRHREKDRCQARTACYQVSSMPPSIDTNQRLHVFSQLNAPQQFHTMSLHFVSSTLSVNEILAEHHAVSCLRIAVGNSEERPGHRLGPVDLISICTGLGGHVRRMEQPAGIGR